MRDSSYDRWSAATDAAVCSRPCGLLTPARGHGPIRSMSVPPPQLKRRAPPFHHGGDSTPASKPNDVAAGASHLRTHAAPADDLRKSIVSGSTMSCDQSWFTATEAQAHLRCDSLHVAALIREGRLHAFRAPALGLLFRRDELDAAPTPLDADEALRLLADGITSTGSLTMNTPPKAPDASNSDSVTLKQAALHIDMPYKSLLRLANEGAIPVVDLNAHRGRKRPCYRVNISVLLQHLKALSEKQAVMRRARPQAINLARLAQPQRGGR